MTRGRDSPPVEKSFTLRATAETVSVLRPEFVRVIVVDFWAPTTTSPKSTLEGDNAAAPGWLVKGFPVTAGLPPQPAIESNQIARPPAASPK